MPFALTAYEVFKALHIMAVVAAFGLPLSYPMLLPYVHRTNPRAMPALHDAQHRMIQRLVAPGTVLVLAFGAYLATKGHYWSKAWVDVPLAILVVIGGVGGGYLAPRSEGAAAVARADVAAAPADGAVAWSAEYERLYRGLMTAETALGILVLVAIFFMAAKPFS